MAIDERRFEKLAGDAFRRIVRAFEFVDSEVVDVEATSDVICLKMRDGMELVINLQRPTRQIWVAGGDRAWHFSYDEERSEWIDSRGSGETLFQTIARSVREHAKVEVEFGEHDE
ncbi:MAG: iron donor protein CyaY [Sandaracinaceae bacterium]|nr:iron donor protein CyaY [Sandaracinaceae bacterium]MDW8245940.1 iron donor protein CyaY [Sandaracinaceae bacterium]